MSLRQYFVGKKYPLILAGLFLLGLFVRFYSISGNDIFFFFDQARDAVTSRQILERGDLKIMGPSVSGTNDSVYHGVFYYYLIAPFYTFTDGKPMTVVYFLSILGACSIIIVYFLGKTVFKDEKIGVLAAFFQTFSVLAIHQSTWLSNPSLSQIFIPLTYFLLWRIFFEEKKNSRLKTWEFVLLGACLALAIQSALQNIVLLGSVLIFYLYQTKQKKSLCLFSLKQTFFFIFTFITGISTMLATEFLMFKRGILTFSALHMTDHSFQLGQTLIKIANKYAQVIQDVLPLPTVILALLGFLFLLLILMKRKINSKQLLWLLAYFLAPLWLLLWHYRDPPHTFISLEVPMFLSLSWILSNLSHGQWWKKALLVSFLLLFVGFNLKNLLSWKRAEKQYFAIQRGSFLSQQLNLIDQTYKLAAGRPFTFSSLTSPYGINTTWGYLYSWYGYEKFGYLPRFVGDNQAGLPGENLIEEITDVKNLHFTIIEPDTTLSDKFQNEYLQKQDVLAGPVLFQYIFGTTRLEERNVKK